MVPAIGAPEDWNEFVASAFGRSSLEGRGSSIIVDRIVSDSASQQQQQLAQLAS
jgi:hypothetical protein